MSGPTSDRHVFIPLRGTYSLRVSRKGAWLHFVRGIGTGETFAPTLDDVLALPAAKLPDLRRALDELAGETEGRSKAPKATPHETASRRHGAERELESEGVGP